MADRNYKTSEHVAILVQMVQRLTQCVQMLTENRRGSIQTFDNDTLQQLDKLAHELELLEKARIDLLNVTKK